VETATEATAVTEVTVAATEATVAEAAGTKVVSIGAILNYYQDAGTVFATLVEG